MLSNINMTEVFRHYQRRVDVHQELIQFSQSKKISEYVNLALGISEPAGNYSASEHGLGQFVIDNNSMESVFNLAKKIDSLHSAHHVPRTIYDANMPYLKISIGSEMAMMLNPNKFWVGNVRTIYTHLLLKNLEDRRRFTKAAAKARADEELSLYKDPDGKRPSEMEYKIWRDIYLALEKSLQKVAQMGNETVVKQNLPAVGENVYMWADAICSFVYDNHN